MARRVGFGRAGGTRAARGARSVARRVDFGRSGGTRAARIGSALIPDLLEVVLELPAPGRVAELAERLRLDLADPLAGDVELLAHLLEGPGAPVLEPEPELQHAPLAAGQRVEDRLDLLLEELVRGRLGRGQRPAVLDEVAEVGVLLLADRRLERDRLLGDLDDLADLLRA